MLLLLLLVVVCFLAWRNHKRLAGMLSGEQPAPLPTAAADVEMVAGACGEFV